MKKSALIILILCSLPWRAQAVDDGDTYNSIRYLKKDLDQSSLVALVQPISMSQDENVKAFGAVYRTNSHIIEPFKGSAKAGSSIEFYTAFEGDPNSFYRNEKRIVFLLRVPNKERNGWIFMELENSTREASKSNLTKIRMIMRTERGR